MQYARWIFSRMCEIIFTQTGAIPGFDPRGGTHGPFVPTGKLHFREKLVSVL